MDKTRRHNALVWGLLAAVLVLGAGLRLYRVGAKSVWLDETAALELAGRPLFGTADGGWGPGLLAECARRDTHPPFYYSLLHLWLWGSDGAARARALSAVLGVAAIGVLYALARRLLGRGPALVASLLLAVSAWQVYFGQEARHYVLSTLLAALSWYFLVRVLEGEGRRRGRRRGLALANAAGMYTFYYHAFAMVAQLVVLLVLWRRGGRRLVAPWCVWQMIPAALFAFYLPVVFGHLAKLRRLAPSARPGGMGVMDFAATGAQFAAGFLAEMREVLSLPGLPVRVGLALLALAAIGVGLAGIRRHRAAVAVALGWLLVPLAVTAVFPFKGHIYEPKHLAFAAPALALLPAIGLVALRGKLKAIPVAVAVLLVAANVWSLVRWYDRRIEKENWRDAVSRIAQQAREGDVLVLSPPYVILPFQYYYRPGRVDGARPKLELREARAVGVPFRGTAPLGKRVWLLQCDSNVSIPNPRVFDVLRPYKRQFHEQYGDLVGTIDVILFDTRQPADAESP